MADEKKVLTPEDRILEKISQFKEQNESVIKSMQNYRWSEGEKINGSIQYGLLQERNATLNEKIELLEWSLGLIREYGDQQYKAGQNDRIELDEDWDDKPFFEK